MHLKIPFITVLKEMKYHIFLTSKSMETSSNMAVISEPECFLIESSLLDHCGLVVDEVRNPHLT